MRSRKPIAIKGRNFGGEFNLAVGKIGIFGGNLIWRLINFFKFNGNLIWR